MPGRGLIWWLAEAGDRTGVLLVRLTRRPARERGQATIEYIALLLIIAAGIALATVPIGGHESLVDTVLDAVAGGIGKSLDKLGVS